MLAERFLRLGVGLLVSVWIARYLGPERLGNLSYAFAVVAILGPLVNLGLDGILVRELVRRPHDSESLISSAFFLKLSGSSVLIACSILIVGWSKPGDQAAQLLVLIVSLGAIFQCADVFELWFQARMRSRMAVTARSAAFLLFAVIKVCLVFLHFDVIAFAWAQVAELMISGFMLWRYSRLDFPAFGICSGSLAIAIDLLRNSWPLMLSAVAVTLYMRVDVLMLSAMVGDREVGIYTAATRVSEVWYFMPTVIVAAMFPAIVRSRQEDSQRYVEKLRQLYRLLVALALLFALPVSIFSEKLIELLYGVAYNDASEVLAVHVWAGVAVFLGAASSQYLNVENLQSVALLRTLLGLVCNIALNVPLIQLYGALGAACATVVAYFVATFALVLFPSTRQHSRYLIRALFLRR